MISVAKPRFDHLCCSHFILCCCTRISPVDDAAVLLTVVRYLWTAARFGSSGTSSRLSLDIRTVLSKLITCSHIELVYPWQLVEYACAGSG